MVYRSTKKVESLEERMAKIQVHWFDNGLDDGTNAETTPEEPRGVMVPEYALGYDPDVMAFVENWGQKAQEAEKNTNEWKQEILSLQNQLKQLESQGQWFGDVDYDGVYQKLQEVKAALIDNPPRMVYRSTVEICLTLCGVAFI